MVDYEALKQAWIRQGYDLSVISHKDLDRKKTKDGKFYTIIPPLEYKDWKDKFFAHFNSEALLTEAITNPPLWMRNFLIDNKDIAPYIQNFILDMTPENAVRIIETILEIDKIQDNSADGFCAPSPKQFAKAVSVEGILCYLADIATSEVSIVECDPVHAPLFALYVVDLKHERKCPIKRCTHGRKCIIESQSYKGDRTIVWQNNKGVEKEYLLRAKECQNTKQPYVVATDYNIGVIFDYLFHLREGSCPLCDSDNKRLIIKSRFFTDFKCLQCGNEFKVYNGNWKPSAFFHNFDYKVGMLHIKYLMGCKILGFTPKILKKYKELSWSANKRELQIFFEGIDIRNRKGLLSFLYKEIEHMRKIALDQGVRTLFEEYGCSIKKI